MTYDEAIQLKNSGRCQQPKEDFVIYVTPENDEDFDDYLEVWANSWPEDEDAKEYCTDGKYKLRAMYSSDGSGILIDEVHINN